MTKIIPTVGRVVWYYEDSGQEEPKAAIVASVLNSATINLMVVEEDGTTKAETKVALIQEGEDYNPTQPFARWMPYQIGQAKKTEET